MAFSHSILLQFAACFSLIVASCLAVVIYRLYFHPLASFPGPKLAAATLWYETYHDAFRGGQYMWEVAKMHQKYGPIVRISPYELHCDDPNFIDVIYARGDKGKRDKYSWYIAAFKVDENAFGTQSHDLHHMRRKSVAGYFSAANIKKLEPTIKQHTRKMCELFKKQSESGKAINLSDTFNRFTGDIITQALFGKSYGLLDSTARTSNLKDSFDAMSETVPTLKHFPFLLPLMDIIPEEWTKRMMPDMAPWLILQKNVIQDVAQIAKDIDKIDASKGSMKETTIVHEVLRSDIPSYEKRPERLGQEALGLLIGGTETNASTLASCIYHLLQNPETLRTLQNELRELPDISNDFPGWTELKQRPYLNAVIYEALRIGCGGGVGRLSRMAHEPMLYRSVPSRDAEKQYEYVIPPGYPIGIDTYTIHYNSQIYAEPEKFKPERWLEEHGERNHRLDDYLMSFSKGSRQCLGMNLAYAELFIALAMIVKEFGSRMRLHDTDARQVAITGDHFFAKHASRRGVVIMIDP